MTSGLALQNLDGTLGTFLSMRSMVDHPLSELDQTFRALRGVGVSLDGRDDLFEQRPAPGHCPSAPRRVLEESHRQNATAPHPDPGP